MAQNTLSVSKRKRMGKSGAREIRKEGNVPAVLYGKGTEPVSLVVNPSELKQALSTDAGENTLLEMHIEGEEDGLKKLSLLREVQYDYLTSKPIHFDFLALDMDQEITVDVPVNIHGRAKGVKDGGVLEEVLREIAVQCLPANIPNSFDIDISGLEMGQSIHVGELDIPEGVTLLVNEQEAIVVVQAPMAEEEPEEEEEVEEGEEAEGEGEGETGGEEEAETEKSDE